MSGVHLCFTSLFYFLVLLYRTDQKEKPVEREVNMIPAREKLARKSQPRHKAVPPFRGRRIEDLRTFSTLVF